MNTESKWLRQLARLNPAGNKRLGPGNERFAPHKPWLRSQPRRVGISQAQETEPVPIDRDFASSRAGVFTDRSPDGFSLRNYLSRPLFFQRGCALRPDRKNVAWHRENRFRAAGRPSNY